MRWTVGLDLRAPSQGAIRFATWMKRQAADSHFAGVHVVHEPAYGYSIALALREGQQIEKLAVMSAEAVLAEAEAQGVFTALLAMQAKSVEGGLAAAAHSNNSDALIVGRLADSHHRFGARLGPCARRLLRTLPTPVIVVPPTLKPDDIGGGPILLASDLTSSSAAASSFAQRLAIEWGRHVHAVHVAKPVEDHGPLYLPDTLKPGVVAAYEQAARDALRVWGDASGIKAGRGEVVFGDPLEEVLLIGRRIDAVAIVCGSRGLSTAARLFGHSIASELAASADRPVVVVPKAV